MQAGTVGALRDRQPEENVDDDPDREPMAHSDDKQRHLGP